MKAILSEVIGPPEALKLGELPEPACRDGDIVIEVEACAINYPDSLLIEDKYQVRLPRPFAPGSEVAGRVAAIGAGVEGWSVGDRLIAASNTGGGLAERVSVPASQAFALPEPFPYEQGSALLLTYATTIHALQDRGHLAAGETLLVLGAAGGTGIAAIQIGKALGARVVAAVSSPEKAAVVTSVGADDVIIYPSGPLDADKSKALGAAFKAAIGSGGANVVYDPVGGDYAEPAVRSLAWAGRYLIIGFTAGIPRIPLNLPLLNSCDLSGVFWGEFAKRNPEHNRRNVRQLFDWWAEKKIDPKIERVFPFEKAGEAIRIVKDRRAIGKVVVQVRSPDKANRGA